MSKKIMILGASLLQLPAIKAAKAKGLHTVVLDMNEHAAGACIADEFYPISTTDTDEVVAKAEQLGIAGVMTLATDMPMRAVAAVGELLGLPTISRMTAEKATNKARMRECLQANAVPIPAFSVVTAYEDFCATLERLPGDLITKPADSSGSRGVYLLTDRREKNMAYDYSRNHSRSGQILVEEYMRGPEVSVETITVNGITHVIAITDKVTSGPPHFVEYGHSIQSALPDEVKRDIKNVANAALAAVGISNGPAHTEIILTDQGPKVVELGARLGGDNITSRLVPLATGIDMVSACIDIAMGKAPNLAAVAPNGSAIRYLNCPSGRLSEIVGIEDAKDIEGVEEVTLLRQLGDIVADAKSSADRVGYVIASGATPYVAIERCEKALAQIKLRVIPAE